MAYALWATLAALIVSGLVMTGGATPMQIDDQRAAVAQGDWSVLVKESDDARDSTDPALEESGRRGA